MYKILAWLIFAAGTLLAACGPAASVPTQPTVQKPIDVQVSMSEFQVESSMKEFKMNTPYRFIVTNKGTVNHDFAISPPVMAGMTMSVEDMHKQSLAVIEANDFPPGTTKTVDVTFTKPTSSAPLEFACHTAGHHEAGMFMPITVMQ